MRDKIIAWDLGTSGNKASLYDRDGMCIAEETAPYPTYYNSEGFHEQNPNDWWDAVKATTNSLLRKAAVSPDEVLCCCASGHSICVIPLDVDGNLLADRVPIWSDARATVESARFFDGFGKDEWYLRTGAGVKPSEYPLFKICWLRNHNPCLFARVDKIVATTDYINYLLTGRLTSSRSNACGTAAYNLGLGDYDDEILAAAGLTRGLFPEIIEETDVVGTLLPDAAAQLGLSRDTLVIAGGPDTVCMPVGARAYAPGRAYISLGTSCWLGYTGSDPLLDIACTPYIFPFAGVFASAISMASGGNAYKWVRDTLCHELTSQGGDVYKRMADLIEATPPGANGLLFNNCLAGGMPFDPGPNMRGGFFGLQMRHNKGDLLRATLEGITFKLREIKQHLETLAPIEDDILLVGGGSQNAAWRRIIADCLNCTTLTSTIDDQAGALGAAAFGAVGAGLWPDFTRIDGLHTVVERVSPDRVRSSFYDSLFAIWDTTNRYMAKLGDDLKGIGL